jgi:hypothetical protein
MEEKAEAFLLKLLSEGERLRTDIYIEAKNHGIRKRAIRSTKRVLGVRAVKRADGWYWKLMQ